ncbi:hypothetical protein F2Q69_00025313 [Brassica cretica]|uniref:F-box domain-containing protein n=1 Tax=Brassica cretica TaxID=69181 RepID=A0A8S9QHK4_BRACR|nr:hypothetical protein F2Q69_00025313 [Brassica cretica]
MKSQEKKNSLSPKRQHHSQISTIEKNSDVIYIPFDLTEEILSKLPVKSLARFQCVSKLWSSLITTLQENTPNSDGSSDGHQGRRTFATEY